MKKIIFPIALLLINIASTQARQNNWSTQTNNFNSLKIPGMLSFYNSGYTLLQDTMPKSIKDYSYYHNKSVGQKTGAWLLVGGAAVCFVIAGSLATKEYENDMLSIVIDPDNGLIDEPKHKSNGGTIVALSIAGLAMVGVSVPLFIAGHRNKIKARVALQSQKTAFGLPVNAAKHVDGFTLTIPIGK